MQLARLSPIALTRQLHLLRQLPREVADLICGQDDPNTRMFSSLSKCLTTEPGPTRLLPVGEHDKHHTSAPAKKKSLEFFTTHEAFARQPFRRLLPPPLSVITPTATDVHRLADVLHDPKLQSEFERRAAGRLRPRERNPNLPLMYKRRNLHIRLRNFEAENDSIESGHKVPLYIFHKIVSKTPYTEEDLDPKQLVNQPENPPEEHQNIFQRLGLFIWKDPAPLPLYPDPTPPRRRPPPFPEEAEQRIDRRRETAWGFFFRRLSMQVTPIDKISRESQIYREAWLTHASKPVHVFRYPREQVRNRNKRINFILQQRNIERRKLHKRLVHIARRKRIITPVFRLAYINFRFRREDALRTHGLLRDMQRLGWSAAKEWAHWRRVYTEGHRVVPPWRRGRLKRLTIALDKIQLHAERRMFGTVKRKKENVVEKPQVRLRRWYDMLRFGPWR